MLSKIETLDAPRSTGTYSQAIQAGGFIFVSGQLPVDPKTGALIEGEMAAMTTQVLDNIEAILKAAGASLDTVVSCQVFLTDLANDFSAMNEAYIKRLNPAHPPARVAVEVSRLPLGARVEIACIAQK